MFVLEREERSNKVHSTRLKWRGVAGSSDSLTFHDALGRSFLICCISCLPRSALGTVRRDGSYSRAAKPTACFFESVVKCLKAAILSADGAMVSVFGS